MGESWDIPNTDQAHLNDWPEETRKKRPIKVIKTARRCNLVTLWACLCVHPHYSFPPNKHFTCFTTCLLCGNYFLQSWEARVLSLRTASVSGREPKPLFKLQQAEVTRDHSRFTILLWDNTSSVKKQTKAPKTKEANPVHEIWSWATEIIEDCGRSAFGSQWVDKVHP